MQSQSQSQSQLKFKTMMLLTHGTHSSQPNQVAAHVYLNLIGVYLSVNVENLIPFLQEFENLLGNPLNLDSELSKDIFS